MSFFFLETNYFEVFRPERAKNNLVFQDLQKINLRSFSDISHEVTAKQRLKTDVYNFLQGKALFWVFWAKMIQNMFFFKFDGKNDLWDCFHYFLDEVTVALRLKIKVNVFFKKYFQIFRLKGARNEAAIRFFKIYRKSKNNFSGISYKVTAG